MFDRQTAFTQRRKDDKGVANEIHLDGIWDFLVSLQNAISSNVAVFSKEFDELIANLLFTVTRVNVSNIDGHFVFVREIRKSAVDSGRVFEPYFPTLVGCVAGNNSLGLLN